MKTAHPNTLYWGKSVVKDVLVVTLILLWLSPGVVSAQSFLSKRAAETTAPNAVVAKQSFNELFAQFKASRGRYLQTRSHDDLGILKKASVELRAARRDGRGIPGRHTRHASRSRSASDLVRKRTFSPDISKSVSSPSASLGVFQDVFAESPDIDDVSALAIDDAGRMYVGGQYTEAVYRDFDLDAVLRFEEAVSNSSARLLMADESTRIRLRPASGFSGVVEAALTFRAWDGTQGR